MALSTLFASSKVAQYVGSLLMIFPIMIFLHFIQLGEEDKSRHFIYLFFFIPLMPACSLIAQLTSKPLPFIDVTLIDPAFINTRACWVALTACIPFWFSVYLYLDSVMPNTYGIQKHPCFCIRKRRGQDWSPPRHHEEQKEGSESTFERTDPILLEGLTKHFGNVKAVDDLTLSIKKGEIFTILGHNGAGKTTAIFMLTGVLQPTAGEATVYGHKVSNSIDLV
jgi:hypothetical protein